MGTKEQRDLWTKMEGRFDRCRLSLLVAPGGIADTVPELSLRKAEKGLLVVLIGPGELNELVQRRDRSAALQEMHRRAVMGTAARNGAESP